MSDVHFDLQLYLHRIECAPPPAPDEESLATLQRAQLSTIPFENFDILLGRGVSLEPTAICDKLLHHSRGGYCFELNGLLLLALQALDFDARTLLARVHVRGTPTARTHQLILVQIGGHQWITDAGFGGHTLRTPLPLELNNPRSCEGQTYQLTQIEPWGIMLQLQSEGEWRDLYSFDLGHVTLADIALGNHYTSTHPEVFFTFDRMASICTSEGMNTLYNTTFKRDAGGMQQVQEIPEGSEYLVALRTHFGIDLGDCCGSLPPIREN